MTVIFLPIVKCTSTRASISLQSDQCIQSAAKALISLGLLTMILITITNSYFRIQTRPPYWTELNLLTS